MMFLVDAASSIRKATALRGCITRPARAWASHTGTPAPPRERLRNVVRSSVHRLGSRVQVAHGLRQQLGKGEEWDPVEKKGSPCSSVLVESYLPFVTGKQKAVGALVQQAAPMLAHIPSQLMRDMWIRA